MTPVALVVQHGHRVGELAAHVLEGVEAHHRHPLHRAGQHVQNVIVLVGEILHLAGVVPDFLDMLGHQLHHALPVGPLL